MLRASDSTLSELSSSRRAETVNSLAAEEYAGVYASDGFGTITISYGDKQTLTGSINDKGVMTLNDPQGAEYVLKK